MGEVELEAAAALYAGAQLERLGPFALADRVVELWLRGGLAGAPRDASGPLDRFWLHRAERVADERRQEIHARVFDERFDELWAALLTELTTSGAGAGARAEDLRAHLAARVDERVVALTPTLHSQLGEALEVLDEPDIREPYGARDVWQLVENLARLELGTAVDVHRVQTLAASGSFILGWLAGEDADVRDEVAGAAASWLAAAG